MCGENGIRLHVFEDSATMNFRKGVEAEDAVRRFFFFSGGNPGAAGKFVFRLITGLQAETVQTRFRDNLAPAVNEHRIIMG